MVKNQEPPRRTPEPTTNNREVFSTKISAKQLNCPHRGTSSSPTRRYTSICKMAVCVGFEALWLLGNQTLTYLALHQRHTARAPSVASDFRSEPTTRRIPLLHSVRMYLHGRRCERIHYYFLGISATEYRNSSKAKPGSCCLLLLLL